MSSFAFDGALRDPPEVGGPWAGQDGCSTGVTKSMVRGSVVGGVKQDSMKRRSRTGPVGSQRSPDGLPRRQTE